QVRELREYAEMLDARGLAGRDHRRLHELAPLRMRRHVQHAQALAGLQVLNDLARDLPLLVRRDIAGELRAMVARERALRIRFRRIFDRADELLPHLSLRAARNAGNDRVGSPRLTTQVLGELLVERRRDGLHGSARAT